MSLDLPFDRLMYAISLGAVAMMAAAGVLEAGRKRFDLFGMVVVALAWGAPWLVASFMGVITGVVGGILRDVLCNEEPLVFKGTLYATASWVGALVFLGLVALEVSMGQAAVAGGVLIFLLRVAAIRWEIALPRFTSRL